eukprot:scaffold502829_cov18-Prasinocladus_malaysianus.AAC.1
MVKSAASSASFIVSYTIRTYEDYCFIAPRTPTGKTSTTQADNHRLQLGRCSLNQRGFVKGTPAVPSIFAT